MPLPQLGFQKVLLGGFCTVDAPWCVAFMARFTTEIPKNPKLLGGLEHGKENPLLVGGIILNFHTYIYIWLIINYHNLIWLVVSNIFFIFHFIYGIILPIDELHHFSRLLLHHRPANYVNSQQSWIFLWKKWLFWTMIPKTFRIRSCLVFCLLHPLRCVSTYLYNLYNPQTPQVLWINLYNLSLHSSLPVDQPCNIQDFVCFTFTDTPHWILKKTCHKPE